MKFRLIDVVMERSDTRLVALKQVSAAEEYLQDHFPTFPVLPGVMMLEAMVQAARTLVDPDERMNPPLVLGNVRSLKYGNFAKPGDGLRVEMDLLEQSEAGYTFKGRCYVVPPAPVGDRESIIACGGKLTLRPARLSNTVVGAGAGVVQGQGTA